MYILYTIYAFFPDYTNTCCWLIIPHDALDKKRKYVKKCVHYIMKCILVIYQNCTGVESSCFCMFVISQSITCKLWNSEHQTLNRKIVLISLAIFSLLLSIRSIHLSIFKRDALNIWHNLIKNVKKTIQCTSATVFTFCLLNIIQKRGNKLDSASASLLNYTPRAIHYVCHKTGR